jgi:hypothetical protein
LALSRCAVWELHLFLEGIYESLNFQSGIYRSFTLILNKRFVSKIAFWRITKLNRTLFHKLENIRKVGDDTLVFSFASRMS